VGSEMKMHPIYYKIKPTLFFLLLSVVMISVILFVIHPAKTEIQKKFDAINISPDSDLRTELRKSTEKINIALNDKNNLGYTLFTSFETKQLRIIIDSIKLSIATGFQYSLTELSTVKESNLTVKYFLVKGKSSYIGLAQFIASIENYFCLMRLKTSDIKFYGVLENSLAFVEYEITLSVFISDKNFFLPPLDKKTFTLPKPKDVFLPFIQNLSYTNDESLLDISEYELKSISNGVATFHHKRFNEKRELKAGDEIKHGIVTEISEKSIKILITKGTDFNFIELKSPE
jgi:hypothetical protein